jgi:hypothetical protein
MVKNVDLILKLNKDLQEVKLPSKQEIEVIENSAQ